MKQKILSLLVLLTVATGAWAADTYTVTFSHFDNASCNTTINDVTLQYTKTFVKTDVYSYAYEIISSNSTNEAVSVSHGEENVTITISSAFEGEATVTISGMDVSDESFTKSVTVTCVKNAPDIDVIPVAGKTNQWEFVMVGSDVVLTPVYADAAKFATEGNKVLAPEAVEGVIAGTTDPIITAGETQQGTVMYFATTEQITAERAAQADGWLTALPTAEGYDAPTTVYVWYYIQGADTPEGETATLENTFNNSEICAQPITVNVLDNKFDLTLTPAPVEKATVTINGTAATPDQAGKIEAVKMNSEVKLKANTGYKFKKVEVKKGAAQKIYTIKVNGIEKANDVSTFPYKFKHNPNNIDLEMCNAVVEGGDGKVEASVDQMDCVYDLIITGPFEGTATVKAMYYDDVLDNITVTCTANE